MQEKKLIVSELDDSKQAFVLAMVQGNLVPESIAKSHPWFSKTPRGGFICLSGSGYQRLCELEQTGFKESADKARGVIQEHWKSWAKEATEQLFDQDSQRERVQVRQGQ